MRSRLTRTARSASPGVIPGFKAREWFSSEAIRPAGRGSLRRRRQSLDHSAGRVATKRCLLGSHLDSVPNGGWLDGCLGVMSALEVLRGFARAV